MVAHFILCVCVCMCVYKTAFSWVFLLSFDNLFSNSFALSSQSRCSREITLSTRRVSITYYTVRTFKSNLKAALLIRVSESHIQLIARQLLFDVLVTPLPCPVACVQVNNITFTTFVQAINLRVLILPLPLLHTSNQTRCY